MGRVLKKRRGKIAVHKTVSEDEAAITPSFDTEAGMIEYLVEKGTDWDKPWTRAQAERFVKKDKWAPTAVFIPGRGIVDGFAAEG